MDFYNKYKKYKNKYLELKKLIGGGPGFKLGNVSGKRVIVKRSRIAKIISSVPIYSKELGNTYSYTVEYTDRNPKTQESNITEKDIIHFPKNIKQDPDTYKIYQPGKKVRVCERPGVNTFVMKCYVGTIVKIRGVDDEYYEVKTDKGILNFPRKEISSL
jgi:hypothetical protein